MVLILDMTGNSGEIHRSVTHPDPCVTNSLGHAGAPPLVADLRLARLESFPPPDGQGEALALKPDIRKFQGVLASQWAG